MTDIGELELERHRYMSLATFRSSGAEVATPVWFAAADGRLYAFTAEQSGKVKRLRHSSRVRVAPSDARGRVRGGWREAKGPEVVFSPPQHRREGGRVQPGGRLPRRAPGVFDDSESPHEIIRQMAASMRFHRPQST